jgi:hypothetical protein
VGQNNKIQTEDGNGLIAVADQLEILVVKLVPSSKSGGVIEVTGDTIVY